MASKVLIPLQQVLVLFHGYQILAVRLPDNRIAVALNSLCRMLNLSRNGQVERIRKDGDLAQQLLFARVETDGGPQRVDVLIVEAIPSWAIGLNLKLIAIEKRPLVLALQVEAVQAFHRAFFNRGAEPTARTARRQPPEPSIAPGEWVDADTSSSLPDDRWEQLYQIIAGFENEWRSMKADIASMKADIARLKAAQEQKPAGAAQGAARQTEDRLSPDHFLHLYVLARSLESRTGEPLGAVMRELAAAFQVTDIGELPDSAWDAILSWFWQRSQR